MADQEPEFKPDTVVGETQCPYGHLIYVIFERLKPEIQSRLLAPSAPGLDREKLLKYLREGVEGFEKTYRKEASQIRALITTLESGRFDVAASRGADKWEKLKPFLKIHELIAGMTADEKQYERGRNAMAKEILTKMASLEAGAPEGEK